MMDSIQVHCAIPVVAIMTDTLREELLGFEHNGLIEVERQLGMLENFTGGDEERFERQSHLLAQASELEARVNRLQNAPNGEKFVLRVVQGTTELKIGDRFVEKMNPEILVEDGVVRGLSYAHSAVPVS